MQLILPLGLRVGVRSFGSIIVKKAFVPWMMAFLTSSTCIKFSVSTVMVISSVGIEVRHFLEGDGHQNIPAHYLYLRCV